MREHELENTRPAPRNTPSIVLWLLFATVVGGVCLLATMPADVMLSSSAQVGAASRPERAQRPSPSPAPAPAPAREPTAMGD